MQAEAQGKASRVGILLINLGTPDAPTPDAVRSYLKEFLSDPRVVEIPRIVWWPILNLIVLRTRPKVSAARYAQIWTREGSPLRVYTEKQTSLLQGYLGERLGAPVAVDYAMRYGKPSIEAGVAGLKARGCDRILLLPLYPQYSASTTATAFDAAFGALGRLRDQPEIRTVRDFHDDPGYIAALEASIRDYWRRGRPDVLVMSFHGVPRRAIDRGDPYQAQCLTTAQRLATALGLAESQYRVTFQSRFGRAEWLKPYTAAVLTELGREKRATVDVVCPGFVADCLETLEEIALTDVAVRNIAGWVDPRPPPAEPENRPFRGLSTGLRT